MIYYVNGIMSYPHRDIIDQIKLERKKQGLTQTELANLLGCPQPSIVRIETRKISPTIGMLQRICDVLGMDIVLAKKTIINKDLIITIGEDSLLDGYEDFLYRLLKPYFKKVVFAKDKSYENESNAIKERECIEILKDDETHFVPHYEKEIRIIINNNMDIYFNHFDNLPAWKIGNIKDDEIDNIVRIIVEEDVPAIALAKTISIKELVNRYGNNDSNRVFSLENYKMYLLNCYLNENYNNSKELETIAKAFHS